MKESCLLFLETAFTLKKCIWHTKGIIHYFSIHKMGGKGQDIDEISTFFIILIQYITKEKICLTRFEHLCYLINC